MGYYFPTVLGYMCGMGVISEVPALGNLKGSELLSLCLTFSFDCPTVQSDNQQTSSTSLVSNDTKHKDPNSFVIWVFWA